MLNPSRPGPITRTTPAKPIRAADQRKRPTRSPSIGTDSATMKSELE
jgi:hypothetical protein